MHLLPTHEEDGMKSLFCYKSCQISLWEQILLCELLVLHIVLSMHYHRPLLLLQLQLPMPVNRNSITLKSDRLLSSTTLEKVEYWFRSKKNSRRCPMSLTQCSKCFVLKPCWNLFMHLYGKLRHVKNKMSFLRELTTIPYCTSLEQQYRQRMIWNHQTYS